MIPMLLVCEGKCRDVTVHQSRTPGHSACTKCGKSRRDYTSSMDGNEVTSMIWANRGAEKMGFTEVGHE